eukprot:scaffold135366_cov15-Tisochrysis_lutea.AAC.2
MQAQAHTCPPHTLLRNTFPLTLFVSPSVVYADKPSAKRVRRSMSSRFLPCRPYSTSRNNCLVRGESSFNSRLQQTP